MEVVCVQNIIHKEMNLAIKNHKQGLNKPSLPKQIVQHHEQTVK